MNTESKITEAEKNFAKTEHCIAVLRAFFAKHAAALEQIDFRAYGWNDTVVTINNRTWGENPLTPTQIAALFGQTGWNRKHSTYTCGAVDWVKELDGCTLTIENAESIKPKLIDEVKLHQAA